MGQVIVGNTTAVATSTSPNYSIAHDNDGDIVVALMGTNTGTSPSVRPTYGGKEMYMYRQYSGTYGDIWCYVCFNPPRGSNNLVWTDLRNNGLAIYSLSNVRLPDPTTNRTAVAYAASGTDKTVTLNNTATNSLVIAMVVISRNEALTGGGGVTDVLDVQVDATAIRAWSGYKNGGGNITINATHSTSDDGNIMALEFMSDDESLPQVINHDEWLETTDTFSENFNEQSGGLLACFAYESGQDFTVGPAFDGTDLTLAIRRDNAGAENQNAYIFGDVGVSVGLKALSWTRGFAVPAHSLALDLKGSLGSTAAASETANQHTRSITVGIGDYILMSGMLNDADRFGNDIEGVELYLKDDPDVHVLGTKGQTANEGSWFAIRRAKVAGSMAVGFTHGASTLGTFVALQIAPTIAGTQVLVFA